MERRQRAGYKAGSCPLHSENHTAPRLSRPKAVVYAEPDWRGSDFAGEIDAAWPPWTETVRVLISSFPHCGVYGRCFRGIWATDGAHSHSPLQTFCLSAVIGGATLIGGGSRLTQKGENRCRMPTAWGSKNEKPPVATYAPVVVRQMKRLPAWRLLFSLKAQKTQNHPSGG